MKVKKVAQWAPKVPTYEVDPEVGEYVFAVCVFDGKPTCVQHGEGCEHAKAVVEKLAERKR